MHATTKPFACICIHTHTHTHTKRKELSRVRSLQKQEKLSLDALYYIKGKNDARLWTVPDEFIYYKYNDCADLLYTCKLT